VPEPPGFGENNSKQIRQAGGSPTPPQAKRYCATKREIQRFTFSETQSKVVRQR
jgi:hypothetical protein